MQFAKVSGNGGDGGSGHKMSMARGGNKKVGKKNVHRKQNEKLVNVLFIHYGRFVNHFGGYVRWPVTELLFFQ